MRLKALQNVVLPGFGKLEEGEEFDGSAQLMDLHPHYVGAVEDVELVEAEREYDSLTRSGVINLLGEAAWVQNLIAAGYSTVGALEDAPDEELEAVSGVGPSRVQEIREALDG